MSVIGSVQVQVKRIWLTTASSQTAYTLKRLLYETSVDDIRLGLMTYSSRSIEHHGIFTSRQRVTSTQKRSRCSAQLAYGNGLGGPYYIL
ncbi:hypothetical protein CHS0354_033003 [Potamilus streckersoni]|uniref:Uncharacterized protein n=1 Tax=Potamilus streckersoni TaxID=2493646 RepID=A0AAE0RX19_9BIVA|nr:hypothetical protein CHS0354_033003 [Potamilus streckersoni]